MSDSDRISHGTPNSHIETHVNRTSREQAIEDLREAEELTNDSGSDSRRGWVSSVIEDTTGVTRREKDE